MREGREGHTLANDKVPLREQAGGNRSLLPLPHGPHDGNTQMGRRGGNLAEGMQFPFARRTGDTLKHRVTQDGVGIPAIHAIDMQPDSLMDCHAYALGAALRPRGRQDQKENAECMQAGQKYPSHNVWPFPCIYWTRAIIMMTPC